MAENSEYTLELLLEYGMVTREQVAEAKAKADESGGELDTVDALKQLGYVDEQEMLAMLANQYGLEMIDLAATEISDDMLKKLPTEIAQQYKVIPVAENDGTLTVAISDPTDMELLDSLRVRLGREVDAVVAPKEHIQRILDSRYGSMILSDVTNAAAAEIGELQYASGEAGAEAAEADDAPIIRLVSMIIVDAFKMKASDIHLEPMEKRYRIRYRIDGALREMESPPKYLQANITSRLKIMAKMDITETRIPLDGRIQLTVTGKAVDLRVSSIPTTHGESIVMRILDKSSIQLDIPQLGFYSDDQAKIDKIINMPDGVFLVTGPTGSGKTTSLYAFLNTINTPSRKIITVEDPVEYVLAGINQVQVNPLAKMTFGAALRAMLRQAPNIIMVGEIRDLETAVIAINAAQTGHLVFSTLHTNDAPSAVTRLIDMGVQPFLVASSVRAIMAQRLCRRVCKYCKEPTQPTPQEMRSLKLSDEFMKTATLMHGKGCEKCGGTGYKGRVGIYEIFLVGEEIQELIYTKCSATKIRAAARKSGMRTLREDSLRKAAAGTTTLAEVLAATMADAAD